jgi:ABC-type transporter lipoprotein component MlaA
MFFYNFLHKKIQTFDQKSKKQKNSIEIQKNSRFEYKIKYDLYTNKRAIKSITNFVRISCASHENLLYKIRFKEANKKYKIKK